MSLILTESLRQAALCPRARHINPSLALVQPRKTRPYITERVLVGRKESNQTNKQNDSSVIMQSTPVDNAREGVRQYIE